MKQYIYYYYYIFHTNFRTYTRLLTDSNGSVMPRSKRGGILFSLSFPFRACSFCSQSMWIGWDWMGFNPKQVKIFHNFFQSHPIHIG
jgi:hypothetical protein